jgi:hypothetical protein
MSISSETRPSNGIALFVIGAILVLIGIIGMVAYAAALPDALGAPGNVTGMLRGGTIVGAAIAGGTGVLLLVLGAVKRRARARD